MNYSEFVRSRCKSGEKIAAEMTPHKAALLIRGCNSLINESIAIDWHKKYAFYNKPVQGVHTCSHSVLPWEVENLSNFNPTPSQCELLHAAIGIAGEAGELLDAVRKHVFDEQPLDRENVIEELGDLCFYIEAACQAIKMNRGGIEWLNMAKLSKRYESGYSDQQAQERKDKQ